MSNSGLFSTVAREYADFRPGYPPELFAWLARLSAGTQAAWDCGCGSGQASLSLAQHFDRVFATDVSAAQIAAAKPHPRVSYSVASAEHSGLAESSVGLVAVAQALHWFDVPAFYAEVNRVSRPRALLAVWTYPRPEFVDAALDGVFLHFYANVVGPYWPPERRHVQANYQTLPFPPPGFEELAGPRFALELAWSLPQVLGYVGSWSATARYRAATGTDPVPLLQEKLASLWRAGETARMRMPLGLRAARKPGGPAAAGS
jgi:SAM-dependent methyltransferase